MTSDFDADDPVVLEMEEAAKAALGQAEWLHVINGDPGIDVREIFSDLGPVSRRVRGRLMRTSAAFDDEFSAAWQLLDYAGPSPGAYLRDCLLDMYLRWPTEHGFAVLITEPEQVLADEAGAGDLYSPLRGLVETFEEAAAHYSGPVERAPSDPLDHGRLTFDVVLVTDAEHRDEVVRRWRAAGAPLD